MTTRWDIEHALRDSGLPAAARLVLHELLSRTDDGGTAIPARFMPSLTDLAHDTGYGRRTVMRALDALESGGWLSRRRDLEAARKDGKPTSYRPKLPPSARAALEARATVTLDPRATVTLGLGPEGHQARGEGRGGARATVAHKARTPEHQTSLSAPASDRDPRALLAKLGATEREIDCIMSKFEGDPAVRWPAVYALVSVGNNGPALIEQARRELARLDADDNLWSPPPDRSPWCGECDERTRWRETDDGQPYKCPKCHPDTQAAREPW